MDTTNLIEFIPAILILISVMTIAIIVLLKYGHKIFDKEYNASNVLLFVATFLFVTILIVHLFREQTWTADTLKILIGALIGASSAKLSEKRTGGGSSVDNSGTVKGDVAGRDINKNIQNIERAISEIQDSVVHQNNRIEQIVSDNSDNDYLINTVYERGDERMSESISRVITFWNRRGWKLKHFSSDYGGADGLFLIFERPKEDNDIQVYYCHGSDTNRFENLERQRVIQKTAKDF